MNTIRIVFKQYIPHVSRYRWYLTLTLIGFGIATLVSAVLSPLMLKRVVDIISHSTPTEDVVHGLIYTFVALIAARATSWAGYRVGDYAVSRFESLMMRDISFATFNRLTKHSYEFFSHQFTGSLVSNANKLVRAFEQISDFVLFNLYSEGMRLVISAIVLFFISPLLAVLFTVFISMYFVLYAFFFKKSFELNERRSAYESRTTGVLADALTNILSIKMFAQSDAEKNRFKETIEDEEYHRREAWRYGNFQGTVQRGGLMILEMTAIGTSLYLWSQGSISAGTIVLLQVYVTSAFDLIFNISRNLTRTVSALSDAETMARILETKPSVEDSTMPERVRITKGAIEIQNISFTYNESNPVFTHFSLSIPNGQRVGLVGHSGSGKTTITKLLLRFLDVQEGSIAIDGQDIRAITQEDLRSKIAYVPQDPLLFHRSIAENIRYGNPVASEEDVEIAAKRAHAHEFIQRLPHGYETLVGERGVRLSGGERQRVAIARAMIKDAPILILDEATSALDSISEREIQAAFDELMKDKTTIVIAHRLSTIQKMDRIIVFEQGSIIEDGTHAALLEKDGLYATLWRQQTSGFIE